MNFILYIYNLKKSFLLYKYLSYHSYHHSLQLLNLKFLLFSEIHIYKKWNKLRAIFFDSTLYIYVYTIFFSEKKVSQANRLASVFSRFPLEKLRSLSRDPPHSLIRGALDSRDHVQPVPIYRGNRTPKTPPRVQGGRQNV